MSPPGQSSSVRRSHSRGEHTHDKAFATATDKTTIPPSKTNGTLIFVQMVLSTNTLSYDLYTQLYNATGNPNFVPFIGFLDLSLSFLHLKQLLPRSLPVQSSNFTCQLHKMSKVPFYLLLQLIKELRLVITISTFQT